MEGKIYTKINENVLKSGGTYDGMGGIISNFSWEGSVMMEVLMFKLRWFQEG